MGALQNLAQQAGGPPWLVIGGGIVVALIGSPVLVELVRRWRQPPAVPNDAPDVLGKLIEELQDRAADCERRACELDERLEEATRQRVTDAATIAKLRAQKHAAEQERDRALAEIARLTGGGQ